MKAVLPKLILIFFALTIPLTILSLQQQQDNRSKAQTAPKAGFIYRDGTKLMLNGSQYKFAGFNADTWFGCWDNEIPTDAQLETFFSELHPRSMTRIWPYSGSDLAIMDRIVAAAEKHDQYLAPSLMDGNGDCGQPDPNYGNPSYELAWVDQIVPRYKDSKAIGFWEIINEPSGDDSNLKNYYKTISDRIKSHDPNHLIGTGSHAAWSAGEGNEAKYISDHDLPNIDLISMHEYDAATGVSHWGEASSRASRALNKPWYAGEDGFCCGGGDTGSAEGNAQKLKEEWAAYIAVPESAGMLYWDFKFGYKNNSTATFGNALWEAGKTFQHQYTGGSAAPGTSTAPSTTAPSPIPPTLITPTIYCVGGAGEPPCSPIDPSNPVTPTGSGGINPTTPPIGGVNPTGGTNNPNPTIAPCSTTSANSVFGHKSRKKAKGGFIEQLIRFIIWLIQFIINGGSIPPINPDPTPPTNPEPTPCPQPTTPVVPTTLPQPTTVPSTTVMTPTIFTPSTAAPTPTDGFTPHAPLPAGPFQSCKPTITIDTAAAPQLDVWLRTKVVPTLQEWYPYLSDTLAYPDYTPRCNLQIKLDNISVPANASFETGLITADITWTTNHPEDMGMFIHEATHIIQAYTVARPEGWITEGIADGVRDYLYKDRIPTKPSSAFYFIDGYSETAYMFNHIKNTYDQNFIRKLNVSAHNGTYNYDIFYQTTKKPLDQIWFDATGNRIPAGTITGVGSKCIDIPNAVTKDGTLLQLNTCSTSEAQRWSMAPSRKQADAKRIVARGKCLDVANGGTVEGTSVWLWSCNGDSAQEWVPQANGTLMNPKANKCLSAVDASGALGTKLVIKTCNPSLPEQLWITPK